MTRHAAADDSSWSRVLGEARNVLALVRRDYLITRSYKLAFVLDTFFGLMNLVTFYFISRLFEGAPTGLGTAPDYFSFAAVGVAIALVVQAASVGLARRLREEQLVGTFELLTVQPISASALALGSAGFPFAFAMVRAVFYLALAGLLLRLNVTQTEWPGLILLLGLTAMALMPIGIALGALVIIFKRGEVLAGVLTFGLGLISGALFPVAELPSWLAGVGRVMPTRYALEGIRDALFAGEGYARDTLILSLFGLVGFPCAILLFDHSLSWARRRGTLSHY